MPETAALEIRKATACDAERAVAIIREAADWLAGRGLLWLREFPGATPQRVARGTVWLAYRKNDAEPIATIALETQADPEFWKPEESEALFVHGLALRPSAGGQGIGSGLLDFAGDQAARQGIPWVRLDCNKTNTQLQQYYSRQGFTYLRTVDLPHRNSGALFQKAARRSSVVHGTGPEAERFTLDLSAATG
jgi:GNAT superfamily N-acetyltransferase